MPTPALPTTFRHPALSLWQSAVHRVLTARGATGEGLYATATHPAMKAAVAAGQALEAEEAGVDAGALVADCASLYARLAVALAEDEDDEVAALKNQIGFSVCDPLWAEVLVQFEKSLAADEVDSYRKHQSMSDFVITSLPNVATVALVADWGTGSPSAKALLERIAAFSPDMVIHLGDVYYSGTPEEVEKNFLDVFDAVFAAHAHKPRVLSLAGNHDRYSGGRGYLTLLDRLGQPSSYLCVRNDFWQIVCADTGLHDANPFTRGSNVTWLEDTEIAYHLDKFQTAGTRGTVLLTHHPPFSFAGVGKGDDGRTLAYNPRIRDAFSTVLDAIDLWFWGHEHKLTIFQPYAGVARGRGIGSAAIPVLVSQHPYASTPDLVVPDGEHGPPAILPGTELGHDGNVYNHAFVLLGLDGPTMTASYYQAPHGPTLGAATVLYTETITRP